MFTIPKCITPISDEEAAQKLRNVAKKMQNHRQIIEEIQKNKTQKDKTLQKPLTAQYVFLGPPSSGKGFLSAKLSEELNLPILSPGNIYRKIREEDTELGRLVKESLKDGGYCPTELTDRIVKEEAEKLKQIGYPSFIFDGYPRMLEQHQTLIDNFNVGYYIFCNSPLDKLKEAADARRECSVCSKIYSIKFPETHCGCCAIEEGKKRWDDSPEMYEKRLKNGYLPLTEPVVDKVKNNINFIELDVLSNSIKYWDNWVKLRKIHQKHQA